MRADTYQILLITAGVAVTALFGAFLYREIFPEYKIYQNDYAALEEFRSTYTHQPLPAFQTGIKQIVIEREDKGPATIDRCISCHVALQVPYFSPTKIAYDLNGNIVRDQEGHPLLIQNDDYIWLKLDEKIAELRDENIIQHLQGQGKSKEIDQRLEEAANYEALKTAHVGDQVYDVTKVLAMHPLIGNETYPFQFHPIEEYGCISCHNGNGRGLVTDKAHGPVFDGQYEAEDLGHTRHFTESDPKNDPRFARIFNDKPSDKLIFQTEPIYIGSLIQAKCVQCHQTTGVKLEDANSSVSRLALLRQQRVKTLAEAYDNEKQTLIDLLKLHQLIENQGYEKTLEGLKEEAKNYVLPAFQLEHIASQIKYMERGLKSIQDEERRKERVLNRLNRDLVDLLGSQSLVNSLIDIYRIQGDKGVDSFLEQHQYAQDARGTLFVKGAALDLNQDLMQHAQEAEQSFSNAVSDTKLMSALVSDVDELTRDFQRGKDLYISQACYACHRIAGFSRGGVGPELTRAGDHYPWYLKRKLMWPQGDLATSTMPNMHFDNMELEDLMTFLLSKKGNNQAVAKTSYHSAIQAWEAGRKVDWEKPISPAQMYDLRYSKSLFATEGCAACHRLQGFESNVGFAIEKENPAFDQMYEEQRWFKKLFPEVVHFSHYDEEMLGSEIVAALDKNAKEIDERIIDNVRQNSLLEEINEKHPEILESLYSPFRFAARAKNDEYQQLIKSEKDPKKAAQLREEWQGWKKRVHRVLMMYIQTYGLGRLIGPHLNWSGIYRSDEWLMEHFRNPPAHVPRSIMPVFPFDETKFYALTHMINVLAAHNRNAVRQIWDKIGFDPSEAYEMLCAQCHGVGMVGNGVIAEWIYPIPKNLHNPEFLRNLTKEKAVDSIRHGIKGTPMPPWGEAAPDKLEEVKKISHDIPVLSSSEINFLVDWMFTGLSGGQVIREQTDVPKWQYTPEDVVKELGRETPSKEKEFFDIVPDPNHKDQFQYYIKKELYTPQNIELGQKFFLINCAVCHGNEADGTGARSQAMQEAKPRMLTNLDWINSRDDLRLLRSIKYGVPGTSMTPWGDLTSSIQRLQLVIFIRSLSKEREQRGQLSEAMYQVFDAAQLAIENARIERNKQAEDLEEKFRRSRLQQENLERSIKEGKENPASVVQLYQQNLEMERTIKELKKQDQQLNLIKEKLKIERDLYFHIGVSIIGKELPESVLKNYLDLIRLNQNRFIWEGQHLVINNDGNRLAKIRVDRQKIIDAMDEKISELARNKKILEGRIASSLQREELNVNQSEIEAYQKIKARLITDTEEALRLSEEQAEILRKI